MMDIDRSHRYQHLRLSFLPPRSPASLSTIMSSSASSSSSSSSSTKSSRAPLTWCTSSPSSSSSSSSYSSSSVLFLLNSAFMIVYIVISVSVCTVASADLMAANDVMHQGTRNRGSLSSISNYGTTLVGGKKNSGRLSSSSSELLSSSSSSSLMYSSKGYSSLSKDLPSLSSYSPFFLLPTSSSSSLSSSKGPPSSLSSIDSSKSEYPPTSKSSSKSSPSSSISRAPTPPPPPPSPPHLYNFFRQSASINDNIDNNDVRNKNKNNVNATNIDTDDIVKPALNNQQAANSGASSSSSSSHNSHRQPVPTSTNYSGTDLYLDQSSNVVHFYQHQKNLMRVHGGKITRHDETFELPARFRQDSASGSLRYSFRNQPATQRVLRKRRSTKQASYSSARKMKLDDVAVSKALHLVKETAGLKKEHCIDRTIDNMDRILTPEYLSKEFASEVNLTVQVANFINALYLHGNAVDWLKLYFLYPLTQSVAEFSPKVKGCGVAFENPHDPKSDFFPYPYSYRCGAGSLVVSDLSTVYSPEMAIWFKYHRDQEARDMVKVKDVYYTMDLENCNVTAFNKHWNRSISVTPADGFWYKPYYDCQLRTWLVQYSSPFYTLNKRGQPDFKGVVLLDVNLEAVPIDQCAKDGKPFSDSHRCHRESTECVNIPTQRLTVGSYRCVCKPGYIFQRSSSSSASTSSSSPSHHHNYFEGQAVEKGYLDYINNISNNYETSFRCIPSMTNMSALSQTAAANTPSMTNMSALSQTAAANTLESEQGETIVAFNFLVRGIPLGIQSFCMTVAVVIGMVIVCLRKTKVMHSSIWILLEMLILGAIFLYATVVIQYFEPTTTTCLLQPWFREIGFSIVYGVLVLKVYRILAEFQSRKAHRVHVRDKDLLKYLFIMLVVVIAYMLAWTAVNIDHLDHNSTILEHLETSDDGLSYVLCRAMWWDYVIEAGELTFLCCGIYMCYCVRAAPTEYREGKFLSGAIVYEAVVSTIFYILRHLWWYQLHPDHLFLMFFLRCQMTVTVVLLVILGPKLWYAHHPPEDDHGRSRAYSQSDVQDSSSPEMMKLNVGISSNGDVEVGEISLTEMDPEDIRAELKRLYTQLQIYKTKSMRKDNPHISKRRGGRKQTHRRFSLQAFHHKHRHHHDHDHEHEMSKTPEESTNSAEAMTFAMEPSVKEEPSEGRSMPSVSFKGGHK